MFQTKLIKTHILNLVMFQSKLLTLSLAMFQIKTLILCLAMFQIKTLILCLAMFQFRQNSNITSGYVMFQVKL